MFLIRSAFWLTLGFLVVAPHGTDFGGAASDLRDQAVNAGLTAGRDLIASQMTATTVADLIELTLPASAGQADTVSHAPPPVMPRMRPAALS